MEFIWDALKEVKGISTGAALEQRHFIGCARFNSLNMSSSKTLGQSVARMRRNWSLRMGTPLQSSQISHCYARKEELLLNPPRSNFTYWKGRETSQTKPASPLSHTSLSHWALGRFDWRFQCLCDIFQAYFLWEALGKTTPQLHQLKKGLPWNRTPWVHVTMVSTDWWTKCTTQAQG